MDMYNESQSTTLDRGGTMEQSLPESWRRCSERLRAELGEDVYSSWFGRIELESIEGGQARLSVPTRFLKSWIDTHYLGQIASALTVELGPMARILVTVRSAARPEPQAAQPPCVRPALAKAPLEAGTREDRCGAARRPTTRATVSSAAPEPLVGSPLDPRLTFSTFHIGRSNQLALSAARRVAENAGVRTPVFSPLYVHSAVGLGKTHLLQAVAHMAAEQGRSAIYLTAEKFMYGFVAALQAQTSIAFKERLRTIDLLIFDDAQFLQGKSIQTEFGHALNA
ncbi:MAG: ATP-binding protein, partial [Hyphomicrobiales bacterium]|nr:ATP-binding protein [Hyphomicrobiales bacterium]